MVSAPNTGCGSLCVFRCFRTSYFLFFIWPVFCTDTFRGRFHQHFTSKFFLQKFFSKLFSITFWLRNFLAKGYRQKSARKCWWNWPLLSISSTLIARVFCTYVVLVAFSSYVLALGKNSYKKFSRLKLMKLNPVCIFVNLQAWAVNERTQ